MAGMLHSAMLNDKTCLIDAVVRRLRSSSVLHYQNLDKVLLRRRAKALVESFLSSLNRNPSVFTAYIRVVADERISEGVFLHEIQTALQGLEEAAWQIVVRSIPQTDQVRSLSQVTGIIGASKDQLAHIYLQHLEKAESRAAILQRRLDELDKGTDPAPLSEEDLDFGIVHQE